MSLRPRERRPETPNFLQIWVESVCSVGDTSDSALAESVIGLFKTEVIRRLEPWKSFAAVEYKTLEWVDWFNHKQLLEPIGNIPPAEAEANYNANVEKLKLAA